MKKYILTFLIIGIVCAGNATNVIWESFDSEVGSRWGGTAGKDNGVWDQTINHTAGDSGSGSMRCQRTPTATEPRTRITELTGITTRTVVSIYFFDDGDDIKFFNVMLKTKGDSNRLSIGLRDDLVGTNTAYVFDANGSVTGSGVLRSIGWHKAEFGFEPGVGVEGRVDGYAWSGNTFNDASYPDWFQFQTDQGTGANNLWVDDIGVETGAVLGAKTGVTDWINY